MRGHQQIIKARLAGKKPAEMVLVCLFSHPANLGDGYGNPTIYVVENDLHKGDFRFLAELDVCLVVSEGSHDYNQSLWKEYAKAITKQAFPKSLWMADEETWEIVKLFTYKQPNEGDNPNQWPWVVEYKEWGKWYEGN